MDGIHQYSRFLFLGALLLALGASGCGSPVTSDRRAAPGFVPGGSNDGVPTEDEAPTEAAGFFFRLTSGTANVTLHPAGVSYSTLTAGVNQRNDAVVANNLTTECRISSSDTGAARDLFCIAEVEELDLFFSELKLQYHVPPSMCSYVSFMPYHFYAYQPGEGPTFVSHTELFDGTIIPVQNTDSDGNPVCSYDYTPDGGGNCCLGKYTRVITTIADDGGVSSQVRIGVEWGGKIANCLGGPAMTDAWSSYRRESSNLPVSRLEYVEGEGFNSSFTISAPIDQTMGTRGVGSSVWAANFYNPSDHVGSGGLVPANLDPDRPIALKIPTTVSTANQYLPADTYVATCFNRAQDVRARIRLMIREWNTNPILPTALGGNPDDTIGDPTNPGFDPGFPDNPINDRLDWLDFGNVYPASST